MKTLPVLALLATFTALALAPLNLFAAGSLFFATGLVSILVADYGRVYRPVMAHRARVATLPQRTERFGLAA